jgi:RimJ/RimL family protein N-acetyltransferase
MIASSLTLGTLNTTPIPLPPAATMAAPPRLLTPRMRLLPATRGSMRLLLRAPLAFFSALRIQQAQDWPELRYCDWAPRLLEQMGRSGEELGWWLWWVTERGAVPGQSERLLGHVGFRGPPSPDGDVELTFAIAPSARRQGLATESLEELMHWAFQTGRVRRILARVSPMNAASLGMLQKLGFHALEGSADDRVVLCRKHGG